MPGMRMSLTTTCGRSPVQRVERLLRRAEGAVRDALARERLLEHPADRAVVVDDPDGVHGCGVRHGAFASRTGSRMVKRVLPGHALELDHAVVLAARSSARATAPGRCRRRARSPADRRCARRARRARRGRRPRSRPAIAWRWRCVAIVTWRAMRVTKRISPLPVGGLRGVARHVEDRLDELFLVADEVRQARVVVALDREVLGKFGERAGVRTRSSHLVDVDATRCAAAGCGVSRRFMSDCRRSASFTITCVNSRSSGSASSRSSSCAAPRMPPSGFLISCARLRMQLAVGFLLLEDLRLARDLQLLLAARGTRAPGARRPWLDGVITQCRCTGSPLDLEQQVVAR